jgi:type IV pilus assembly protein PilM
VPGPRARRGLVGLDIGTSAVRAAEISVGSDSATLHRFGQVSLPDGAVRDGEITDPASVTAAIKQLWQTVKFSSRKVAIGVANQRVVVRQVEVPWLPERELRKSLGFQVGEFIPMPVDQAVLDFDAAEEVTADDGRRMLRILLVAANKDMVMTAVDVVSRAGLEAVTVDLTPFAMIRSLGGGAAYSLGSNEGEAIVDLGADVTNIVVHSNGVPRFVRVLMLGGGDLTDAVAERLGLDLSAAEDTKIGMKLASDAVFTDAHPGSRALESAAGQWIEELRQSLDYYAAQEGSVRIRRVVLTGGGSQLEGLPQRLATAIRLPVVLASPLHSLKVGKSGLNVDELSRYEARMAVPVGLALGRAS